MPEDGAGTTADGGSLEPRGTLRRGRTTIRRVTVDRREAFRPPWFDVALVALLILVAVVTRGADGFDGGAVPTESDALAMVLSLATILPLLWRRRFPIQVLVAAHVFFFLRLSLGYSPDGALNPAVLISAYTVGAYAPRPAGDVVRVVAGVIVVGALAVSAALEQYTAGTVVVMAGTWIAVAVIGDTVYARRRYQQALEERARALGGGLDGVQLESAHASDAGQPAWRARVSWSWE